MIGLVVVGHGDLPQALMRAAESVLSGAAQMRAVSLEDGGDPGQFTREIEKAVRDVDKGEGVIIMTDMMGGTPTNSALAMLNHKGVEVVTGVNLPMLLKLSFIKGMAPKEAATFLVDYGRRNLAQPSEMLRSLRRRTDGQAQEE